jgi:hypothetical protein
MLIQALVILPFNTRNNCPLSTNGDDLDTMSRIFLSLVMAFFTDIFT